MPYGKRYYKKSYKRRGRSTRRRSRNSLYTWNNVTRMAKDAFWLSKKLARMVNVEYKTHLVTGTQVYPQVGVTPPVIIPLVSGSNAIAQGDTSTTRDGDSLKPMNMTFRFRSIVDRATSAADRAACRLILFHYKQINGQSTPAGADVLDSGAHSWMTAGKNWDNRFHYKFLFDKTYTHAEMGDSTVKMWTHFQKLYGHIRYTAGTNNIENGAYFLLLVTDDTLPNPPILEYTMRLTFTDN